MVVSKTDFDYLPYNIEALQNNNGFLPFAADVEDKELRSLLGSLFYDAFVAGVAALPAQYVPATTYALGAQVYSGIEIYKSLQANNQGHSVTDGAWWEKQPANKWLKMLKGDSYTYNNIKQKWAGMVALCKPLVYAHWLKFSIDNTLTVNGVVQAKVENGEVISSEVRFSEAYQDYAIKAGQSDEDKNSLLTYLLANATSFDVDVEDTYESFMNYLDIEFEPAEFINDFDL